MKSWREKLKANDPLPLRRWRDFVKCVQCGHTLPMIDKEKGFCQYCGRYIFKENKDEFIYRVKEKLR